MPKYYEPPCFETNYCDFLRDRLSGKERRCCSYIDPDAVEDVTETSFYNDLTDFLNGREKELERELKNSYFFLPPLHAPETYKWLEKYTNEGHGDMEKLMDEKKMTVMQEKEQLFCLTSDQFGFSAADRIYEKKQGKYPLANLVYSCQGKSGAKQEEIIKKITKYVKNTRTVGGSFLWPVHPLKRKDRIFSYNCTYNLRRGVGNYLEDRVDLTLLEVKHALDCAVGNRGNYEEYGKSDILYDLYEDDSTHMKEWLGHFGSFRVFVEYFMLEPFCERITVNGGRDYEYMPVNIIDGKAIDESKMEDILKMKVRNLEGKAILNMLERLECMILARTANMERVKDDGNALCNRRYPQ